MTTWVSDLLRNVHQYGQCDEDGSVTLANASPEVLAKIRDEADEVLSFGLQAVDGIGDAIYFLRHSVETESGERGMGLALQLLSDLMVYAKEVKNTAQSAGAQTGRVDAESNLAPAADLGAADTAERRSEPVVPGDETWPDRMNPFVDRDVHETLQNVIEGIRLVQHSLFRTDRNEAREVRFSAEQWHGLHRHCETLVKALQHEAVYLADSLGERHKLRPGAANPRAQGRGQEALS